MWLEMVGTILATAGAGIGGITTYYERKEAVHCKDKWGAYPWLWSDNDSSYPGDHGFRCPKCSEVSKNKGQPDICSCMDYPVEHFHWKCIACKYTALMRTFDDRS